MDRGRVGSLRSGPAGDRRCTGVGQLRDRNREGVEDVVAVGQFAYVGSYGSFRVVDLADPYAPSVIGSIALASPTDIDVVGDYAYVVDRNTTAGFKAIDVSDPANPVVAGSVDIGASANDVVASGDFAYVAHRTNGLRVLDISTPSAPSLLTTLPTNSAESLAIEGNLLYLIDDGDLLVIDVSVPEFLDVPLHAVARQCRPFGGRSLRRTRPRGSFAGSSARAEWWVQLRVGWTGRWWPTSARGYLLRPGEVASRGCGRASGPGSMMR